MRQIIQDLKTGKVEVAQLPIPSIKNGQLLIKTSSTLISAGTERMLIEFGKAGWIEKARMQPDKVRMVLDKIKTDGLEPALGAVFNKLDQPLPLGYCNVGVVTEIGKGVAGFDVGDRVVNNGKHAEVVCVPKNLCALVPDNVSDDEAAFTVLASVALQSIRLVKPTLGEVVVVTGLGLIGLLTVQLLRAHGCRVLGLDFDQGKLELAKQFGAEVVNLSANQDPLKAAENYSRGRGVDAVIIAAATKTSDPIHQAALMCRKRGRIVLVGVTGLELSRDDFFKKELTFQVSSSYGPGRYDPNYEEKGQDYPIGYVRWTEQRNFEAVLDMMADGRLDVKPLVSHRFDIDDANKAYELVSNFEVSLGILLQYPGIEISSLNRTTVIAHVAKSVTGESEKINPQANVSFLGSGNYANAVLMPAFKSSNVKLCLVASNMGVSGLHAARKFGFSSTTTDPENLFIDDDTDAVVITTQHDSHARFVIRGLESGKHVFVEKPLCLTMDELENIRVAYEKAVTSTKPAPMLMVGFNRRFSPYVQKIKQLLVDADGPKSFIMTVNAGAIPADHWTQDPERGGGRIIGEVCHFIDLLRFLAASPIDSWSRVTMDASTDDTVAINLKFTNGSIGTINYFANGSKSYPKERLQVFSAGRVLELNNYRKLTGFDWPNFKQMRLWRQDKGQNACANTFVKAMIGDGVSPIPIDELLEVSRVAIQVTGSTQLGKSSVT
ncbi:bi-domain-containing oxidoreductase [Alphaproteobacteria bacterium]|nr:bi-domain-containing oxidoreductase [Alphaproteobacteria bacterium]